MQGYFEREGVLYIRLRADERTKLVVLHDDAYTEGSKADVLRLMQQCAPETKEVQT